jgi:hypothetical protein
VVWYTNERHEDVLERIGASHAGGAYFVNQKFQIFSGYFPTPQTPVIVPDDYAGEGLSFSETQPLASIVNGVRGSFADPLNNYQTGDYPSYQDAAALSQDGGVPYWLQLDLQTVTSHTQAQRLSHIAYNKGRFGHSASVQLQFKHFNFVSDDVVQITDDLAGFSAKTFRITGDALDENYVVSLQLEYEASTFYSWTAGTDEQDYVAPASLTGEPGIQPPGAIVIDTDGTSGVTLALVLAPSPSAGADILQGTIAETHAGGSSSGPWSTANVAQTQTIATFGALAATITTLTAQAKNSVTGEVSAAVSIVLGTPTTAALNGVTEVASTQYCLPPPKAPRINSVASGNVQLLVETVPGSKSQQVELWENSVNNSGTATLVATATNSNATFTRTGTPGAVKFYWARTKNATDSKFSGFSNPTLVVF